jgi:hypothetical protein
MYLAVTIVDVEPEPTDTTGLHRAIEASATEFDKIEHVCVERTGARVVVALYLLGADAPTAGRAAEQLCRRALASWRSGHTWAIQSGEIRTVGSSQRPTR